MGWSRRRVLGAAGGASFLAGCGGNELAGAPTPPPTAFDITASGDAAIELRYTGVGSQDPGRFRVVLRGGGPADGAYGLDRVTNDTAWTDEDRYVLNRTTLGLDAPLRTAGLSVELQYRDDGDWYTLVRAQAAD